MKAEDLLLTEEEFRGMLAKREVCRAQVAKVLAVLADCADTLPPTETRSAIQLYIKVVQLATGLTWPQAKEG